MRVLIIEDDPALGQALFWLAEEQGSEPRLCSTAASALEISETFRPDLVILDLTLPDRDGMEICASLKEATTTDIVVYSADESPARKKAALAVGCSSYLVKGRDFNRLTELLSLHPAA